MKIKGFNEKEQRCFNILKDGEPHKIGEMKRAMMKDAEAHCREIYTKGSWDDSTVDAHAQSYVRNSIRRLIRDGWLKQTDYGTYRLTPAGKKWVAEGKDTTKSFGTKRGRKPGTTVKKTETKKAAKKAPGKPKSTKKTKAKSTKKAPAKAAKAAKKAPKKTKAKSTKKTPKKTSTKAKSSNGKSTKPEAKKAAKKAKDKSAMMKKAQAAKKRVGKLVALEKAKAAQKSEATAAEA